MKRVLIASIIGIAASVASSYAQGVISFDNYTGSSTYDVPLTYGINLPVGLTTGDLIADGNVEVGLYAGANNASTSALSLIATTFINPATPGFYVGGNAIIPSSIWTGNGTIVEFQVRAWETVGTYAGATYAASQFKGASATWTEQSAIVSSALPSNEPINGPATLELNVVPEPTTMALGGLGLASLLIMRRRQ
jgi:hypothetical protein